MLPDDPTLLPADPIQAVVHPDPYPYYRMLAQARPCYYDAALALWIISAPAAIRAVLDHPAARVRPLHEPVPRAIQDGPAGTLFGRFVRMGDGPGHAALKPLLAQYLGELRQDAAAPCWPAGPDGLPALDRYLFDAPIHAMAAWLGLPPQAAAPCAQDVARFRASLRPAAQPADIAAGHAAAARLQQRLRAHLDAQPDHSALGMLRRRAYQAGIATATVAANLAGLLFQSCEAGAGLIGNTLVTLGRDAALAAAARRDAGACLQAAAHAARHDPPVHNTRRYLAAPVMLPGHAELPAGATVLLVLAAAGMAEAQAAPWTFGAGRHACPGHAPALQAAGQAVAHLLRAGWDPAALPGAPAYWPLPNARIPRYAVAAPHGQGPAARPEPGSERPADAAPGGHYPK